MKVLTRKFTPACDSCGKTFRIGSHIGAPDYEKLGIPVKREGDYEQ